MIADALTLLPEPLSPRSRQRLAAIEVVADAGERVHRALRGVELDREIPDLEQVVRLSHRVASAISRRQRCMGVGRDPHPAREQVEGERGQHDREPGKEGEPPGAVQVVAALRDHQAPGDLGRLDADAEEAQSADSASMTKAKSSGRDGDQRRHAPAARCGGATMRSPCWRPSRAPR